MIAERAAPEQAVLSPVPSFRAWQSHTYQLGMLPIIGVAGTLGKSTVLRMLEAIFNAAHLRTAVWSNQGIEIRGKRQRDELGGWSRALGRLAESTLDVVIQELDWSTVNAVGLPPGSYPLIVVTNLMAPDDHPLPSESANRGAVRVVSAVHARGTLVINGDDPALVASSAAVDPDTVITSLSRESPSLNDHIADGNFGSWVVDGRLSAGTSEGEVDLLDLRDLPVTLRGSASFEVSNVVLASAVAMSVGIDLPTIKTALQAFQCSIETLPGSFNVLEDSNLRAVIDRLGGPGHTRNVLRAANPGGMRRQVTVVGDLNAIDPERIQDFGRLIGRTHGAVVLHSTENEELIERFKKGVANNTFPPLFIQLPTERRALNRALNTVGQEDVLIVLATGDPGPAIRAIQRHMTGT